MIQRIETWRYVAVRRLLVISACTLLLTLSACNKQITSQAQTAAETFASPEIAGNALRNVAKSQDLDEARSFFGEGSTSVIFTGDRAEDKVALNRFAQAYQIMNRWRKLNDHSDVLIVGADNETFPIPLTQNPQGRWYFDVAAGEEELEARRIGRDEIAAINVSLALADSQAHYYSQEHGGVKQYAQKFISDPGQQNGLYWQAAQESLRSPLGPQVAFATQEGLKLKPNAAHSFYGYYFRMLPNERPDPEGGSRPYLVDGKMIGGFAYVAYPEKYSETGMKTFIVNQQGVVYEKDLGKDTGRVVTAMTDFSPDSSWTALSISGPGA